MITNNILFRTTIIFFLLFFSLRVSEAQFKTPSGNVAGTSSTGLIEFQQNTSGGGLKLIRNNTSTMRSRLSFWQTTTEKWSLGIDPTENNTNSFYIYGGNTPTYRLFINPLGMVGLNMTTPSNLLHLVGGDITVEETTNPALDGTGPGADIMLKDKDGGILDVYSDGKEGGIALGGGSSVLRFFRYSTNDKMVIGNVNVPVSTGNNYRLYVEKGILTEKLKIAISTDAVNWADFVFEKDYQLKPLCEVEQYIKNNHHLPEIPSAKDVYKEGLDVAQMDAKLLQKIEELTLYIIELEKNQKKLNERLLNLERK